jgi:hypothetical protein
MQAKVVPVGYVEPDRCRSIVRANWWLLGFQVLEVGEEVGVGHSLVFLMEGDQQLPTSLPSRVKRLPPLAADVNILPHEDLGLVHHIVGLPQHFANCFQPFVLKTEVLCLRIFAFPFVEVGSGGWWLAGDRRLSQYLSWFSPSWLVGWSW